MIASLREKRNFIQGPSLAVINHFPFNLIITLISIVGVDNVVLVILLKKYLS